MNLDRKPSVVDPNKRMLRTHPFYIWRALHRFRVMDRLRGEEGAYHSPEEIAGVLFSNWADLEPFQRRKVVTAKIDFPLLFLKHKLIWVEEETTQVENPDRWDREYRPLVDKGINHFRAKPGPFLNWDCELFEPMETSWNCLDEEWGYWTGRRDRYAALMKKMIRDNR